MGFNDIGISNELDWARIRKLLSTGIFASILVLIGDFLLGYGVPDGTSGIEGMLYAFITLSDRRLFWSSLLGMLGIPLQGLCCFGIYRIIASGSMRHAHIYRSGIFLYLIFPAFGVHAPCISSVFVYKHLLELAPASALEITLRYAGYFLVPGTIGAIVAVVVLSYGQIAAFAGGHTPYPRWCWIFSLPIGMALVLPLALFPYSAVCNAITTAWISIGNLWMFCGLLFTIPKAQIFQPAPSD